MHTFSTTVRIHHTDAAGILFFANLFVIAHECYESYLDPEVTFHMMFNELNLMLPIVHAEADYHKPLQVSDRITVELRLGTMRESSYSLEYDILTEEGERAATVKTSHVVKSKDGRQPASLPEKLIRKLESLRE
jgi:YbgC/YbaW family acyl-CoA thioester hydrolase